jgi:phage tail sheath protein FI
VPGFDSTQVGAGVLAHCKATNRNAYLAGPVGETKAAAKGAAKALLSAEDGGYLRYLTPWVTYTDETGASYTVPPEGFAAAGRAKAILAEGVWRADAGAITRSRFLTGVATVYGGADGDELDDAHVTVIRMIGGRPETYGMRSLATDDAWALFKHRDLVNKVATDLPSLTQDLEFGTLDSGRRFLSRLTAVIKGYLAPIAAGGGLYARYDEVDRGVLIDPGYSIDTSDAVNPVQQLAQRKAAALVVIRPSESANEIAIHLVKAALTASV